MPLKKGAGGHMQNYDTRGRYAKTNRLLFNPPKLTKEEKAYSRELQRREELYNRAAKSRDPFLFEIFDAIETAIPGEVVSVNSTHFDHAINRRRELDIITKGCIIEVKSGKAKDKTRQFEAQRLFAEHINKHYVIIAPDIAYGTARYLKSRGFNLFKSSQELITFIKENKK